MAKLVINSYEEFASHLGEKPCFKDCSSSCNRSCIHVNRWLRSREVLTTFHRIRISLRCRLLRSMERFTLTAHSIDVCN